MIKSRDCFSWETVVLSPVRMGRIFDKFGGCKKSFSWLGQKVNKKIAVHGHDADDSCTDLLTR